jgi:hypothetical protein
MGGLKRLRAALKKARPAIFAVQRAEDGYHMRGFSSFFSQEELKQGAAIAPRAALYELDHVLWPKYREVIVALLERGEKLAGAAAYLRAPHSTPQHRKEAERKLDLAIKAWSTKYQELEQ